MAEAVVNIPGYGEPLAYEQLTATGSAASLTASKYKSFTKGSATLTYPLTATVCVIAVSTQGIRVTFDGTAPVAATTGLPILAGQFLIFRGSGKIAKMKFIAETGSPVLDVLYFLT